MCPTDRAALVREQGLRPFTPTTPRTVEELETELLGLRTGDVVVEHGAYRSGVSCAARGLAGPPGGAAWALVISARGEVREAARRELASAAARLERRLVHTGP
jgi:DNA-binding IclR family transcriptional regulator